MSCWRSLIAGLTAPCASTMVTITARTLVVPITNLIMSSLPSLRLLLPTILLVQCRPHARWAHLHRFFVQEIQRVWHTLLLARTAQVVEAVARNTTLQRGNAADLIASEVRTSHVCCRPRRSTRGQRLYPYSTLTGVFFKLPSGTLSDVLGRKRMMVPGALFFAARRLSIPSFTILGRCLCCRAQKLDRSIMRPAHKHDEGLRARVLRRSFQLGRLDAAQMAPARKAHVVQSNGVGASG